MGWESTDLEASQGKSFCQAAGSPNGLKTISQRVQSQSRGHHGTAQKVFQKVTALPFLSEDATGSSLCGNNRNDHILCLRLSLAAEHTHILYLII